LAGLAGLLFQAGVGGRRSLTIPSQLLGRQGKGELMGASASLLQLRKSTDKTFISVW